jgi:hypothetical protein
MLYREAQAQAQVLAFIDDFRLLAVMYTALVLLILGMRHTRGESAERAEPDGGRALGASAE